MTIHTAYYGDVAYEEEDLLLFPEGIFGFPNLTRYLPLSLEGGDAALLLLQSVEDEQTAFFLLNPIALPVGYAPSPTPEELALLGVQEAGELAYYCICVVRSDYLKSTVNLKCPLAVNPDTRQGLQLVLTDAAYDYRHPLRTLLQL